MPLTCTIVLLWLTLIPFTISASPELPDMGAPSDTVFSPEEEKRLGEAFYRQLHQQVHISQDPEIQDYISSLGGRLIAHSDVANRSFHFFVVMDPQINAFAGPAGYIGVNSGLILATQSEGELASVLAHEIAHVAQQHLKRAFAAAKQLALPLAAATLAAILLGAQSPELGQAAFIALQAGSIQHQINFTRSHEQEADHVGIQILSASDFDPRSMPTFFERLQQSTRFLGQDVPEFLRTHPVTSARIADSRARAETFPYRQYPDSLAYLLTKAKLQVLTATDLTELRKSFNNQRQQGIEFQQAAASYGLALALKAQNQLEASRQMLTVLLDRFPDQPQFIHAMAQVELVQGQTQQALSRYQQALQRFPAAQVLKLEYAEALLETRHFQSARQLLEPFVATQAPRQPIVFKLLSRAYAGLGKAAESHRYLAEYYYASGDLEQAIFQAALARKLATGDRILEAIAKQRLKVFRAEDKARKQR
ncbi:MAG: M48 family metalloprotease [Methylohalobius sp.]|nr:M48 family metalloprotease [Methylohalobius sp.]